MVFRIKFRIHSQALGGGKYVYNVRDGATLYLSEWFRPTGPELAHYCVMVRQSSTTATLLKAEDQWNNQSVSSSPVELRPGHILSANGVSIEVLECPMGQRGEVTKFLDLEAMLRQAGEPPTKQVAPVSLVVSRPAPMPAPSLVTFPPPAPPAPPAPATPASTMADFTPSPPTPFRPAPLPPMPSAAIVAMPEQSQFADRGDETEAAIPPISLDHLRPKEGEESPAASVVPLKLVAMPKPLSKMASEKTTQTPAPSAFWNQNVSPKTYGMVAGGFAVMIFFAYWNANRVPLDLIALDDTEFTVPTLRPIQRAHSPAFKSGRAPASVTANAPPPEILPLPGRPINPVTPTAQTPPPARAPAIGPAFLKAIDEGNIQVVEQELNRDGALANAPVDALGRTAFLRAAASGRISLMQFLLAHQASATARDRDGNTALMWAARAGREKSVQFLLTLGIDANAQRHDGKNAFAIAQENKQGAIAKLLKKQPGAHEGSTRSPASHK